MQDGPGDAARKDASSPCEALDGGPFCTADAGAPRGLSAQSLNRQGVTSLWLKPTSVANWLPLRSEGQHRCLQLQTLKSEGRNRSPRSPERMLG